VLCKTSIIIALGQYLPINCQHCTGIDYFCRKSERLEAHFQNHTYYFYPTDRKPEVFTISMYNFPYTLVRKDGRWKNHPSNKMEMAHGLVVVVTITIGEPVG